MGTKNPVSFGFTGFENLIKFYFPYPLSLSIPPSACVKKKSAMIKEKRLNKMLGKGKHSETYKKRIATISCNKIFSFLKKLFIQ